MCVQCAMCLTSTLTSEITPRVDVAGRNIGALQEWSLY